MSRSVSVLCWVLLGWALSGCDSSVVTPTDTAARWTCPAEWVASARGGCGPAVALCAPGGGAAAGACASIDLTRSHPVGDGGTGESFRRGADGEIAGAWRAPGEPGGPPSSTWTPDAGVGAPAADWHPDAGIPTCPSGWTRTSEGLCDPALAACPEGAEPLPGGRCTATAERDCPSSPYADPGPEAMGAPLTYVSADAPASCSGRGSQACPWRTITDAITSGRAWVLVGDGTYSERVEVTGDVHLIGRCAARVRIENPSAEPTLFAHGARASLDLRGVTVTGDGIGVEVEDGARVRGQSLKVLRCVREGVRVLGPSNFDATEIVIADTRPQDGGYGHGANIGNAGSLRLTRAALLRNRSSGASSLGGALSLFDAVVSGTRVPSAGQYSTGVYAQGRGHAELERVWIDDNDDTGMGFVGSGTIASATDVTVRGTRQPAGASDVPRAVLVQSGATFEAARLLIDDNRGHGVYVERAREASGAPGAIAHATIRDSVIRGPRPGTSREKRVGLFAQIGSDVRASGVRITDAVYAGVVATGSDTTVTLDDTLVAETRESEGTAETSLGCGLRVEQGARLVGRRVEIASNARLGVLIDEPLEGTARATPDLTLEDSVVRGNRFSQALQSGGGVLAQRGGSARLERVRVTANEAQGVSAAHATLTIVDSVVEDTVPVPRVIEDASVRGQAQNLVAQGDATVTVIGVRVRAGRGATGAVAGEANAVLNIRESLFEGIDGVGGEDPAACLVAEGSGAVVAERVALRRCYGVAAYAQSGGARLSLTDSVVQGTRSRTAADVAPLGRALSAIDGTTMTLTRVLVEDNAELGVVASGEGTAVTMSSVVVRDIRPLANGRYGQGLFASEGARMTGDRVIVSESSAVGVFSSLGASLSLTDSLITDVRASPLGLGNGATAIDATFNAERVVVRRVFNAAISAMHGDADGGQAPVATLRDVIVYDVRGNRALLARGILPAGIGLYAINGGRIEAERVTLLDLGGFGVWASPAGTTPSPVGSRITLGDLYLSNVRAAVAGPAPFDRPYGFAMYASDTASIVATRGVIDGGMWGFVLDHGAITARQAVVTRQSQGLGMSLDTVRDTRFTGEGVVSRENLQSALLYGQREAEITVPSDTGACPSIDACRAPRVR